MGEALQIRFIASNNMRRYVQEMNICVVCVYSLYRFFQFISFLNTSAVTAKPSCFVMVSICLHAGDVTLRLDLILSNYVYITFLQSLCGAARASARVPKRLCALSDCRSGAAFPSRWAAVCVLSRAKSISR